MLFSDQPILITGGAGFIGNAVVRACLCASNCPIVNLDKLTYAGNRESLTEILDDPRHTLVVGDIADESLVSELLRTHRPQAVVHLAAQSHVDRSIADPALFVATNVSGTCKLLQATRDYWQQLAPPEKTHFRFLNVSTDEVFGAATAGAYFDEQSPFSPNSPYAASKAGAELLAKSFYSTYGFPVLAANPSNNYGPRQHPEKFIPRMILAAARGERLPVFGDGLYERDWMHVEDCSQALLAILAQGLPGERYLVGANCCLRNREVVYSICDLVDELLNDGKRRRELITQVADRPGHDRRYAVDASFLRSKTGWQPRIDFARGLAETVRWYLENPEWVAKVSSRTADF